MTTITFKQTEWHIQHEPDQPRSTLPPLPDTTDWPNPKLVPSSPTQPVESKCIITFKNQPSAQPVNADHSTTTFHDSKDFWNIDLGEMLLRLGQKVIQGNQRDEWLSMVQVASLCRRYRLKWQGGSTRAFKLEQAAKDYLDKHGDIRGGGSASVKRAFHRVPVPLPSATDAPTPPTPPTLGLYIHLGRRPSRLDARCSGWGLDFAGESGRGT